METIQTLTTISIGKEERIGYITLNRPEKRNALSPQMVAELKGAFAQMTSDTAVKAIVLKAEGKVFCAGADLAYLQQLQKNTREENLEDSMNLKEMFQSIYDCPKPVIAQVHGHAIAGGCGLANVCDFVFAVPEAKFGYTEVRIGFIPAIVMLFLIRKIGESRAKELLLWGGLIDAAKAYDYGMVNFLSSPESLEQDVKAFATELCQKNSGQSMAMVKEMCDKVQAMTTGEALDYAANMNADGRGHEDCKRGIAAFLNKERLSW